MDGSDRISALYKCWERVVASEDCRAVGYKYPISGLSFMSIKEIIIIKKNQKRRTEAACAQS